MPSNVLKGFALAAAVALASAPARAEIVELRLNAPEPFAAGRDFGTAGGYVRITGTALGELDPKDPRNKVIADLDKAPLNARGRVEYQADVFILRPADPAKGAGVLLYEATNRGRKLYFSFVADSNAPAAAQNGPTAAGDVGNAFGLDRGYTFVWSGWDPDAPAANNGMRLTTPVATDAGKPIVQRIRHEFQIATRGPGDGVAITLPYAAADTAMGRARLTVRGKEADARVDIADWEFVNDRSIRLKAGARFEPVKIYELWYDAKDPHVLGIGYAATRDLVAYLRNAPAGKLAVAGTSAKMKTLAVGISQSGRYLRHFLDLGMNADEKGRRVFDGVLAHISGAGKVFANHRFGNANRTATQHEDRHYPENWFPFGYREARDPVSAKSGRLVAGRRTDPLVIDVNTSTEYWQKGASLVHTDPAGRADALLPPTVRAFLIAGTQHGGRAGLTDAPGLCAMPRNPHSAGPALRALLATLEDWVVANRVAPPSRVPEIARKTAVVSSTVAMPKLASLLAPVGANAIGAPVDWVNPPNAPLKPYGVRVPAVDADGNETAGLRLPPIAVPLGTHTGWNLYKAAPSDMCDRDGAFIAFARTKAEREAAGDPRPSLQERYGTPEAYVAKVKAAADALALVRLLLPRDAAAYVEAAKAVKF